MPTLPRLSTLATILGLGLIGVAAWAAAGSPTVALSQNPLISKLRNAFESFTKTRVAERIHLHTDRTLYAPGEAIWFNAFLLDEKTLAPSTQSHILHVELIGPKGNTLQHLQMVTDNLGGAPGDIVLDPSWPGGIYTLKAYTEWSKNELKVLPFTKSITMQKVVLPRLKMKLDFQKKAYGPGEEVSADLLLESLENKPLSNQEVSYAVSVSGEQELTGKARADANGKVTVKFELPKDLDSSDVLLGITLPFEGQTEGITRPVPVLINRVNLTFYPEGGEMVAGLKGKVAFRARTVEDKPADVKGHILDGSGKTVAHFESYHFGMGAFEFTPQSGETYRAQVTSPMVMAQTISLSEVLPRGYTLRSNGITKDNAPLGFTIGTTETETLSLVVRMRDSIYFTGGFEGIPGGHQVSIPTGNMPMGVAQVTLFDKAGIPRAERMVFVNGGRKLNLSVTPDKITYGQREKVNLSIRAFDERGLGVPARLSLSVADDVSLSYADDRQGHILSSMLLSDLAFLPDEPNFYFDQKEAKAPMAMDYLMMTSGWRRFQWLDISRNVAFNPSYVAQKTGFEGVVLSDNGKTEKDVTLQLITSTGTFMTKSDKDGKYSFNQRIPITGDVMLNAQQGVKSASQQVFAYGIQSPMYLYEMHTFKNLEDRRAMMVEEDMQMAPAQGGVARGNRVANNAPMARRERRDKADDGNEGMGAANADQLASPPAPPALEEYIDGEVPRGHIEAKPSKPEVEATTEAEKKVQYADDLIMFQEDAGKNKQAAVHPTYFLARVFPAKTYKEGEVPAQRDDYRKTLHWDGNITTGADGRASVSFFTSDAITSFRAILEGVGMDGTLGHVETTFATQVPLSLDLKVPTHAVAGDILSLPLVLKNTTPARINGVLNVTLPKGWTWRESAPSSVIVPAQSVVTINLNVVAHGPASEDTLELKFKAPGITQSFSAPISTQDAGFKASANFGGNGISGTYALKTEALVPGSLKVKLEVFPGPVDLMLAGLENMLRQPYGCFEQTSSTNYPNVMIRQYLQEMGTKAAMPALVAKTDKLLAEGYSKLTSFESKEKGYEWFGGTPAHEGLTAYGVLQFTDMARVCGTVEPAMIDRTVAWLLSRRDGKGGFKRSAQALDEFGRASEQVQNAYIVYSLTAAGRGKDIKLELDQSVKEAKSSKDPYILALVANSLLLTNDDRATQILGALRDLQSNDGSWKGSDGAHTITYSTGAGYQAEATALSCLALMAGDGANRKYVDNGIRYLLSAKTDYGFSTTQGTVLALKALTTYAKYSAASQADGKVEVIVNGKPVYTLSYKAGQQGPYVVEGLEQYLRSTTATIEVKSTTKGEPLPHQVTAVWNTTLPPSNEACPLTLTTKMIGGASKVGSTTRLQANLVNTSKEGQGMCMALIGIPAGLTPQPQALKSLQESGAFDFYELRDGRLALYYRSLAPGAQKQVNLDLKADVGGNYTAPASSAYVYYTPELRRFIPGVALSIAQ